MAEVVATSVVSAIASKVAVPLFDRIQREICYVFKYERHVEKLTKPLEEIKGKKSMLEQRVENAKSQGDKIFENVENYLIEVKDVIERIEKLVEEEDKIKNTSCFIGLCPNLMSRHKLGKEAFNAAGDAKNLSNKASQFESDAAVFYRAAPERQIANVTRGYQQFDSRMKVFNNVMEALKDSNVDMIGVYGMGGVGKTTLVEQVKKKVMEDQFFDEVVMAEVTQSPDLKIIRDKFAYDLGLTFRPHDSVFERVDRLRRSLKEKRVLVILDNIWEELKLEDVGIPFGDGEAEGKNVQRRCTVLLTSRSHDVLRKDMNSQTNFPIKVLSNEEAMVLFWKTVDDHSMETSDFQLLADEIVRKCEGLPVAIKTIAGALKHQTLEVWRDALNGLRNSDVRGIPGMHKNVYSAIELSYNFLENKEAKSLFRLCALQNDGSRILINDLMTYVMGLGLGLFKNVSGLEDARNRVHTLIDILKSSCLLLDADNEHVKMHDIIHAVGVSIAAEEHMFNIQNVRDLKEELKKDPIAISLTCRDIQELPERLGCPNLKLFSFGNYGSNLRIQNLCFEGMNELRVLNLTRIVFPSLPPLLSSLTCLSNLQTLSLIDCGSIVDVALVGELKMLEILSFRGSDIEQLPMEIGQLTLLKKLDLSRCSKLNVIAPNVISKLTRLEELCMVNSFTQWENGGGSNASLVELNALSQLTTLEIKIPDVKIVPRDLVSVELERFKILLGDWWDWFAEPKFSRTLKFKGLVKSSHFGQRMKMLLKRAEELYLDELIGFHHFHELDDGEGFPQLKYLSLKNIPEISYIVNLGKDCCNVFSSLDSLSLCKLMNLEKICHGQLTEDQSFSKLRIIMVKECHELKHLFSFSMAKNLSGLREINLTNCKGLKLIVGEERENSIDYENEGIIFAQLHSLSLTGLPQLRCSGFNLEISRRLSATSSSASKEIVAVNDPQDFVRVLFNNKVTFPILETLNLSSLNIENIWPDQFSTYENLSTLEVKDCRHLKFLFSYSMVGSLVQLQNLVIEDCKSMECVINTCRLGINEQMSGVMVFSKLKSLILSGLPNLTRFVCMNLSDTQSFFNGKVTFSILKILELSSLNIEKIWSDLFSTCQNLTKLDVKNCNSLKFLFSYSMVPSLVQLQNLVIKGCESMECVINTNGLRIDEEQMIGVMVFSKLKSLSLSHLPNLTRFVSMNSSNTESLFNEKIGLPSLEILTIRSLPKLRKIWHHQLDFESFSELKRLEVFFCDEVMNIFSSNIILGRRFRRLEEVRVIGRGLIKEIIEEETSPNNMVDVELPRASTSTDTSRFQVFPQLTGMQFMFLPNFTSIYQGLHMLEWPMLKNLEIHGSLKFLSEVQGLSRTDYDELRRSVPCSSTSNEIVAEVDPKVLFNNKITFPILKTLKLSSLNIQKIWPDQLSTCENLTEVKVLDCHHMKFLFSYSMVLSLVHLQNLVIEECESMECVINTNGLRDEEQMIGGMVLPKLKSLILSYLPYLTRFVSLSASEENSIVHFDINTQSLFNEKHRSLVPCSSTSNEIAGEDDPTVLFNNKLTFPILETLKLSSLHIQKIWSNQFSTCENLTKLEVRNCPDIKFLFSYSMVLSLVQLKHLVITECESMEYVIHTNRLRRDEEQIIGGMVLPKLKSLSLTYLPTLTRYVSMNTSEENNIIHTDINTQSLFNEKVTFPILKRLELFSLNIQKIWLDQFCTCQNLTNLEVGHCNHLKFLFSYSMVPSLVQLQNLMIRRCKSMEFVINTCGLKRDEEQMIGVMVLPKLKSLSLSDLPNLTRFISMNSSEENNIMHSDINAQFLFNEEVAFPNLNDLEVRCCNELKILMTISTVESLVQLKGIRISNCNMIEEIIQVGEVKVDHVVFSQLEYLELDKLPRLKHFFGGNCTIEFPYLRQLAVSGCLNMKIFSQGVLLTPKLQKVQLTDNYSQEKEALWEGSLNSTVQKMFEEMAGIYGLDNLILSQVPRVKEIWYEQTLPVNVFSNLRTLVVDDCKFISSAIPANPLRYWKNLETLTVKNCDSVKEVFHLEVLNADLLPRLLNLYLIDLPKLKRFVKGGIIRLHYLKSLTIENCPNMETFIFNFTHAQPIANEKVAFLNLMCLELSKLPKLLHLYKENSSRIDIFQNLKTLKILECCNLEQVVPSWVSFWNLVEMKITKCDGLINLVALSTAKSLVNLRKMKITECEMIEEIIDVREEMKKDSIVFLELKYLELSCLPSLLSFCLANYTLKFPSLEQVIVKECPKMEIFSRGVLCTPKLEILQLTEIEEEEIVKEDEWLWEGSLNSTIQKLFEEMNVQSSNNED